MTHGKEERDKILTKTFELHQRIALLGLGLDVVLKDMPRSTDTESFVSSYGVGWCIIEDRTVVMEVARVD